MPFKDAEPFLDLFDIDGIQPPEKTAIATEESVLETYFEKHEGHPSFLEAIMRDGKQIHLNPRLNNSAFRFDDRVVSIRGPMNEYSSRIESFDNFLELINYNHPGIVKIRNYMNIEKDNERLLIAEMDFLKGQTLDKLVAKHDKEYKTVLEILINIASSLEFVHSKDMVHLDLIPRNIIWHKKYEHESETREIIKNHSIIIDMDSMRKIGSRSTTGEYIITHGYFAPEISKLCHQFSNKEDIINFSIISYELLTGKHPYLEIYYRLRNVPEEEKLKKVIEYLSKRRKEYICSPKSHNDEIPRYLSNAILKGMKFNPEERFDSISELKEVLMRAFAEVGGSNDANSLMSIERYSEPFSRSA